jgi:hypothetical protein
MENFAFVVRAIVLIVHSSLHSLFSFVINKEEKPAFKEGDKSLLRICPAFVYRGLHRK